MLLDPAITFYLIRHGETDWNRVGRLQGQTDVPLNALGRDQAAEAGRRLARLLRRTQVTEPSRLDYVSSPLSRARETMAILRGAMGLAQLSYRLDDRLRELGFGAWEGLTWPEVKTQDVEAFRERKRDKWRFVPPGGAESYAALGKRIIPWLATVKQHDVVVAHGGVARALMVLIAGVEPAQAPEVDIWQGRVLAFAGGRYHWD